MTAYGPAWTGRIHISYFAAKAVHSQTWRYAGPAGGSGQSDCTATIHAFYVAQQAIMWEDFVVNAVTVADVDSNIFLPIENPFTDIAGEILLTDFEPDDKAKFLSYIGRTTAGGPWKVFQYGLATDQLEVAGGFNYRVLAPENVDVAGAIGALQFGAGSVLGNDGQTVAFYNYANSKPNDRWVKKVRRGA